jgi:fengycin family lipopeptide synthetase E
MSADARDEGGTARLASCSSLDPSRPLDLDGPVDRPFEPLPQSALERPIFEILAAVAARAPDAIALEDGDAELSYGDVLRQASGLARSIGRAVEPGEPVGIAVPNGIKCPVAMLAALAAGRPYVPLDLTFPADRNALIVRQSGMKAVIVDHDTRAAVRAMDGAPPPLDFAAGIADGGDAPLAPSSDDIAYILYTSGSEGQPKGVHFSQRSLLHQMAARINVMHLSAEDRQILLVAPMVGAAQLRIWASLLSGGRVVMVDLRRKGLQEAARIMAQRGITIFAAAPYVFRRLMEVCRDPAAVATVRNVNVSSDPVFASDVVLFRERFSESCVFSTLLATTEAGNSCFWYLPRGMELDRPLLPVGYALPDFEVSVVDEEGQPVPRGEIGEITVASRYIAEGYWRNEALTRRAFSIDPHDPERRINRTGDLGRMQADGLVELVGRKDRQLKIRGYRVEPTEIEATLRGHPAIRDAAIIPRSAGDIVDIIAYATVRPETQPPTEAALASWLAERMPRVMRPRRIYLVPALPMLGTFKPDIRKLQEFDRERAASEADAAAARMQAPPSGLSVHEAVRNRWERALGRGSFAADLSWDQSGGDSLKALELVFALEEMLQRPVAMGLVGPATRPSELIAALEVVQHPYDESAAPPQGRMRLFFLPGYAGVLFHETRLVHALQQEMDVEVLDYPPIVPTRVRPFTFDEIVAHVLGAISSRASRDRSIGLLGYSLGASVAVAAAGRLTAEGRDIAYVGILDASPHRYGIPPAHQPLPAAVPAPSSRSWLRPLRRLGTVISRPHYGFVRFVTLEIENRRSARLAWLWRALVLLRMRRAQTEFRELTARLLRTRARHHHAFEPFPGAVSLFRAIDNWSDVRVPDDLGWGAFCRSVEVQRVPGDHLGMLAPGHVEGLAHAIVSQCKGRVATRAVAELQGANP